MTPVAAAWRWLRHAFAREVRFGELHPVRDVRPGAAAATLADLVFANNAPYSNKIRGAVIHAITRPEAAAVAALIEARRGLPPWYLAACIWRESKFDPQAYNLNLDALHRAPLFERTDWGLCQQSGRWLPGKPGMEGLSQDQMRAKALDPEWAVGEMAREMAGNISWANAALAFAHTDAARVRALAGAAGAAPGPYDGLDGVSLWLATMAYNSGNRGALQDLEGPQKRTDHPNAVMQAALKFRAALQGGAVT